MIKRLLENHIKKNIPDSEVAVLLSGGVDSLSVALAAHHAGKKVHTYSFYVAPFKYLEKGSEKTGGGKLYDFKTAEKFSKKQGWKFTPVEVPTENIVEDWYRLVDLGCIKKTHFECVFPFLYVYPEITEKYVLSGWIADAYHGVSRLATLRHRPESTYEPETFDDFRNRYLLPDNRAGLKWHNRVVEKHDKIHIVPYFDSAVKNYFYQFTWEELNRPEQKIKIREDFTELKDYGNIKPHTNLHLGAGINKLFETLLNNREINFNNRKRMMDVCLDWKNKNGVLPI